MGIIWAPWRIVRESVVHTGGPVTLSPDDSPVGTVLLDMVRPYIVTWGHERGQAGCSQVTREAMDHCSGEM